jgi:hypothetical protein
MADNEDAMEDEEDTTPGVPISEHVFKSPSEAPEDLTASEYWKTPSAASSMVSEMIFAVRNNA